MSRNEYLCINSPPRLNLWSFFPDNAIVFKSDPPAFTQKNEFMVGIVAGLGEKINGQLSPPARTGSHQRFPPKELLVII